MTARPFFRAALVVVVLTTATSGSALAAQTTSPPTALKVLTIHTVPAMPHVRFVLGRKSFTSDAAGVAKITAPAGTYRLTVLDPGQIRNGVRATFARWGDDAFTPARRVDLTASTQLQVGFEVAYHVGFSFADLHGRVVSPARVRWVTLSSTLGSRVRFAPRRALSLWLPGGRVARRADGLEQTQIKYAVETVVVDGANVVHHAQQRFLPATTRSFRTQLLLYSARITSRDVLFHRPTGNALVVVYPNGHRQKLALDADGVYLPALARGTYGLRVVAKGFSPAVPLSVSKNQVVALRVVSVLDFAVVFMFAIAVTIVLVLARRPRLRARLRSLGRRRAQQAVAVFITVAAAGVMPAPHAAAAAAAAAPDPVLAYYYIWYDHSSWRRAKIDYPLLGRYSSDDVSVLRRHVAWAQESGLDGFIVSWKSTPTLDARLSKLVHVADVAHFKLVVIYQGLDFYRRPLPAQRVRADLEAFSARWRNDRAFNLFGRPVVIWSGTWKFSAADVASVTRAVRPELSVLASERSVAGFERLRGSVDGDAYYWSSVDPSKDIGFGDKLAAMGDAVHRAGGLWIPPAAPGFDARLIGGHRVVTRRAGATLRTELNAAQQSSPDAVGVISWNEFSENSAVEPSVRYGWSTLNTLRDLLGGGVVATGDFDSSDAPTTNVGYGVPLFIGIALIGAAGAGAVFWRREVRRVAGRA